MKTRGRWHLISASGRRKIEMITGMNPKRRQRRREDRLRDMRREQFDRQKNFNALMP